ncbi:hypothetical protein SALBM311S_13004 [Streptomyces alboniger]
MIVVTTPTGQIGREVVTRLLDAHDASGALAPVRVIVRDPAALSARVRDRVEVVRGSHADPAVLKEACQGADRVFWLVPPTPGADSVEGHFRAFTEPLCEIIAAQGLERVVSVSTLGRGVARNAGLVSASAGDGRGDRRHGRPLPGAVPSVPDGERTPPGGVDPRRGGVLHDTRPRPRAAPVRHPRCRRHGRPPAPRRLLDRAGGHPLVSPDDT